MIFWGKGIFFHLGHLQFMLGGLVIFQCWIEKLQPHDILTHLWEEKCLCAFLICFLFFLREVVQYISNYLKILFARCLGTGDTWLSCFAPWNNLATAPLTCTCSLWCAWVEICLVALLKRLNLHGYWLCMYPSTTIIRESIFFCNFTYFHGFPF